MKVYGVYHSYKYCKENYYLSDFGGFFLNGEQKDNLPIGVPRNEGISALKCGSLVVFNTDVMSQAMLLDHFKAWKGFVVTEAESPEYFI